MGMTRDELVSRVASDIGRTDKDSDIQDYLNWALKELARVHRWKDLEVYDTTTLDTVADQKRYQLPSDLHILVDLILEDDDNSRRLVAVHPRRFDDIIPYPESDITGRPKWYVQYGNYVELYPIPDDAYNLHIRYYKFPSEMTSDSDTPDITNVDDVLCAYAAYLACVALNEPDEIVNQWKNEYMRRLSLAIAADKRKPDYSPIARGFDTRKIMVDEYWKNPLHGLGG